MVFLATYPLMTGGNTAVAGGIIAFLLGIIVVALIIGIALYVYLSFAFMSIAKRAKSSFAPGIAWIPVVGPALIASDIAGMHWWPILLLIGTIIPVIGGLFSLAFAVFMIIWLWKVFERLDRPGWWAILCIIPIVNLVLIGVAAWGGK